ARDGADISDRRVKPVRPDLLELAKGGREDSTTESGSELERRIGVHSRQEYRRQIAGQGREYAQTHEAPQQKGGSPPIPADGRVHHRNQSGVAQAAQGADDNDQPESQLEVARASDMPNQKQNDLRRVVYYSHCSAPFLYFAGGSSQRRAVNLKNEAAPSALRVCSERSGLRLKHLSGRCLVDCLVDIHSQPLRYGLHGWLGHHVAVTSRHDVQIN